MKPKAKKIRMTDAEIKEATERDKEWMDSIGPDDEIVVDKKIFGGILGTLPLIPKRGIVVGCAIW